MSVKSGNAFNVHNKARKSTQQVVVRQNNSLRIEPTRLQSACRPAATAHEPHTSRDAIF